MNNLKRDIFLLSISLVVYNNKMQKKTIKILQTCINIGGIFCNVYNIYIYI
jgi:poly(3-hydroxyalkanoate) synthetase